MNASDITKEDALFAAAIIGVFAIVGAIEQGAYLMAVVACAATGALAFLCYRAKSAGEWL